MCAAQPLDPLATDIATGFTQQLVREETAAHADLAVNAPHRQLDAFLVERLLPGEDVLIDAIDEGAVEIEQEGRFDTHDVLRGKKQPYMIRGERLQSAPAEM